MLPLDKDIRDEILTAEGNIVISASAGTGKTYTTIQRINRDIEENTNFQTFAAITFTRKAAKEIIDRLGQNKGEGFVGTNDNFILVEIIQPFMYDVYGKEFKRDVKPDFSDENQISKFDEGIDKIRDTQLMCKYDDNHKNFAFQLALKILKNSKSAKRYIKSKYYRIYIDEYQDCDVDMHAFFMFLCDELNIPLFIVGDSKQSIYGWRGAYSDGFTELLTKTSSNTFDLWHNFRSNKVIQNYSNIFMSEVRKYYQETEFTNEVILFKYNKSDEAVTFINNWIDESKSCSFLNFSNTNAEGWSLFLNDAEIPFVYIPGSPLDYSNLESEHIWIARALACYFLQKRYSEYDFMSEIPMPEAFEYKKIKDLLKSVKDVHNNESEFVENAKGLYEYLGYIDDLEKIEMEIKKLLEVINDEKYIPTYNQSKYKLTSGTIHSSKGLEYEQVIINAGDYDFTRSGIRFLHYVAVSRPKERLLILAQGTHFRRYSNTLDNTISETKQLGITINKENVIKVI